MSRERNRQYIRSLYGRTFAKLVTFDRRAFVITKTPARSSRHVVAGLSPPPAMTEQLANSAEVVAFTSAARHYGRLLDERQMFETSEHFTALARAIASLYSAALALPDVSATDGDDAPEIPMSTAQVTGTADIYNLAEGPLEQPELTCGSLTDDIRDIHRDVMEGLALFDRGQVEDAVWHWRMLLNAHWGTHAVNALQALHRLIATA